MQTGGMILDHSIFYDRLILLCTAQSLESAQASQYFSMLTAERRAESIQVILVLATDNQLYQRTDQLGDKLKERTLFDFRGWEDPAIYNEALTALVKTLSAVRF